MAMKGYTMEQTIPAPPAQVFAVLADLGQAREWMPKIRSIDRMGDTAPLATGSRWIEARDTPKGVFVSNLEVTEFEEDRVFALRAENKQAELTFRFTLEPADGGTKVVAEGAGRLKGMLSMFSGKLVAQMHKEDADLLTRLEAQVARQASSKAEAKPKPAASKPAKAPKKAVKKAAKGTKKSA